MIIPFQMRLPRGESDRQGSHLAAAWRLPQATACSSTCGGGVTASSAEEGRLIVLHCVTTVILRIQSCLLLLDNVIVHENFRVSTSGCGPQSPIPPRSANAQQRLFERHCSPTGSGRCGWKGFGHDMVSWHDMSAWFADANFTNWIKFMHFMCLV